jgi:predicted DNA-binding protein
MNDLEKLALIDETLSSFDNLTTLWEKVGKTKGAQKWLKETMEFIIEDMSDDDKHMIPEEYLNKEVK